MESKVKTNINSEIYDSEEFRTNIKTMDNKGKRQWVFPKKPSGKFTKYRSIVSYVLLALFFITPFIKLPNGNPLFEFNVFEGQFILFGFPFFTSDFFLLAIGMLISVVFIVVFTQIYGRIFCGWMCPQTIFMESVFRKIEFLIEGDRAKQMKLDSQSWDEEKIRKRVLKWSIFAVISLLFSGTFYAYIVGMDRLVTMISDVENNIGSLTFLLIFAGLFYFVFAWFREQVCTLVCPYGRLQGVLVDKKTIMISYDFIRGEREKGRAKFKKDQDRKAEKVGDCIDCNQCVVVCPTGIDIRNGNQLECVNCTACIDACDTVMEKAHMPTGLIRYASEENIENGTKFKFSPRIVVFSIILVLLQAVFVSFLLSRNSVEAKILHIPGTDYTESKNEISNAYQYTLYNKTNKTIRIRLKEKNHKNSKVKIDNLPQGTIEIKPMSIAQGTLELSVPKSEIKSYKEPVDFEVYDEKAELIDSYKSSMIAPFGIGEMN